MVDGVGLTTEGLFGTVSYTFLNGRYKYMLSYDKSVFGLLVVFFLLLSEADDRKSLIFLCVFSTTVGFMVVLPCRASDTLYKSPHWFSMNPVHQSGLYKGKGSGRLAGYSLNTCSRKEQLRGE